MFWQIFTGFVYIVRNIWWQNSKAVIDVRLKLMSCIGIFDQNILRYVPYVLHRTPTFQSLPTVQGIKFKIKYQLIILKGLLILERLSRKMYLLKLGRRPGPWTWEKKDPLKGKTAPLERQCWSDPFSYEK